MSQARVEGIQESVYRGTQRQHNQAAAEAGGSPSLHFTFLFSRVILEVHWPAKNPVADGFWLVWSAGEWDVHVQITMEYTPGSLKCWAG